ncbi:MAG: UDP-glucose 4-epimerase GalE [Planctomycetes bacterium HGW-Planctomycetes-2]|nr:MAG: UDP-glucose 4-epimerase GalE [Planctomycetes bacterium HGW-Planctomycetes-2]
MRVVVTGGAGYIGSHACKRLLEAGHSVVVIDNLVRGHAAAIERLRTLPGVTPDRLVFVEGAVGDAAALDRAFGAGPVEALLHFAALAYVRESMDKPLEYYHANTSPAPGLFAAARRAGVRRIVFSSTCATYGAPSSSGGEGAEDGRPLIPIREDCPQAPINPYGWSKLFVERILLDLVAAGRREGDAPGVAILRYFNVAGCDRSGLLGEDHTPETHIIPLMLLAALGKRPSFTILGEDHATPDGTCVRDYIHVEDLVDAHLAALEVLAPGEVRAYNLGIGRGFSVREVARGIERVTGRPLTLERGPRHPGDPPTLFCDASKIERELGWRARVRDLDEIVASAWEWFRRYPDGYPR